MSKDFNYKEFANQLRFQVRGIIPEKYNDNEIYVRDMIYKMTLLAGEQLYTSEDEISEGNCQCITQIIAEWTFHKTLDMICCNIPQEYHEAVLHKINHDIYEFLIENKCSPYSPKVIDNVEKLVNKSFKKAMFKLFDQKAINKTIYNSVLKQSNINEMAEKLNDTYSVPVSIWDVLKVHPFLTLAYTFTLSVILIAAIVSFYAGRIPVGITELALFMLLLFRFLTRESQILIRPPEDEQ